MTWLAVFNVLVQLFGPVLVEWLRRLLNDAAKEMPGEPSEWSGAFDIDLTMLFDRARGKTWGWQFRKRAALRLAERAALRRADEIRAGVMGRVVTMTPLNEVEVADLKAALA